MVGVVVGGWRWEKRFGGWGEVREWEWDWEMSGERGKLEVIARRRRA